MFGLNKEKLLKFKKLFGEKLQSNTFLNSDSFFFSSLIIVVLIIFFHLKLFLSNYYLSTDWDSEGFTQTDKYKFWYWTQNDFEVLERPGPFYTNYLRPLIFEKLFYKNPLQTLYDGIKGFLLTDQNWLTNFFAYKLFCEILLCIQFLYLTIKYNAPTSFVISIINYNAWRFWICGIFNWLFLTNVHDQTELCSYSTPNMKFWDYYDEFIRGMDGYSKLIDEDSVTYDKELIFQSLVDTNPSPFVGARWVKAHLNSPYMHIYGKWPIFEDHTKILDLHDGIKTSQSLAGANIWRPHLEELTKNHVESVQDLFENESLLKTYYGADEIASSPLSITKDLIIIFREFLEKFIELRIVVKDDHIEYINFYRDPLSLFLTSSGLYKQDSLIGLSHFIVYELVGKTFLKIFFFTWDNYLNIFFFQSFNRRLKDFIPYLVRWHWTTQFLTWMIYSQIGFRFYYSAHEQLVNYSTYVEELVIKKDPDAQLHMLLYASLDTMIFGIHFAYIPFSMFCGLHAILGQYFYIPGITTHVELHIGRREDNSIFSGGSMDWQRYEYAKRRFMWYGMLGRGRDRRSILFLFFDFIKNLLIKFFKKFILFLKRD